MHFFTKSMPAVASAGSSFHLKSKSEEQNISSIQVQDKSLFIIIIICMSKCLFCLLGVSEGSIHGKFSARWFVHFLP